MSDRDETAAGAALVRKPTDPVQAVPQTGRMVSHELGEIARAVQSAGPALDGLPADIRAVVLSNLAWVASDGRHGRRGNLAGRDLHGLDFSGLQLNMMVLTGCNLVDAVLHRAALMGCDLRRANLAGADLGAAVLCGANLSQANLRGARLLAADLGPLVLGDDGEERRMLKTLLIGAELDGADFNGAETVGAVFEGRLTEAA